VAEQTRKGLVDCRILLMQIIKTMKIRTVKIYSKMNATFWQNFTPMKIPHYMVLSVHLFHMHYLFPIVCFDISFPDLQVWYYPLFLLIKVIQSSLHSCSHKVR